MADEKNKPIEDMTDEELEKLMDKMPYIETQLQGAVVSPHMQQMIYGPPPGMQPRMPAFPGMNIAQPLYGAPEISQVRPAPNSKPWVCKNCGRTNTTNFCPDCGSPRTE